MSVIERQIRLIVTQNDGSDGILISEIGRRTLLIVGEIDIAVLAGT